MKQLTASPKKVTIHPCSLNRSKVAHVTLQLDLMTLCCCCCCWVFFFFLLFFFFPRLACTVYTCLAPEGVPTSRCGCYVCLSPYMTWIRDVSSIGPDLIDWLLLLLFVPIDSFISSIHSIILSAEVHPKTLSADAAQYTAVCDRVALLRTTRSDSEGNLNPSCPHLSSGLLRSPSFPLTLTSPSLSLLTTLILSSRLPSLAPRWLLSARTKWLPCRFLRCRHFLALPFPSNVNPFLCDSCFLAGLRQESTSRSTADEGETAWVPLGREEGEEVQHFLFPPQCKQRTAEAACAGRYAIPLGKRRNQLFLWLRLIYISPLRQ